MGPRCQGGVKQRETGAASSPAAISPAKGHGGGGDQGEWTEGVPAVTPVPAACKMDAVWRGGDGSRRRQNACLRRGRRWRRLRRLIDRGLVGEALGELGDSNGGSGLAWEALGQGGAHCNAAAAMAAGAGEEDLLGLDCLR